MITIPVNHKASKFIICIRNAICFLLKFYHCHFHGNNKHFISHARYSFVSAPLSSEIVCTRRGDYSTSTKVTEIHDNPQQNSHLTVAIAFKYGLLLLAALLLPVILFKMFILPMAILTSLKMISLVNSFLLGSLLLKYKWAHAQAIENGGNNHGNGNGGHTGPGGIIGPTGNGGMNGPTGIARPTALGNRIELGYDD